MQCRTGRRAVGLFGWNSEGEGVGEVETDVVALEVFEDAEQREVGFSGGFMEPLHPMRPGAVIDDVGQMRVQGEGEKSCWAGCRCLRQDGTPQIEFSARGSKEVGPACCY